MTTDPRALINRAKKLDAAATPGPWQARFIYRIATIVRRFADRLGILFMTDSKQDWADAEFCAESRTIMPALAKAAEDALADASEQRIIRIDAEHDRDGNHRMHQLAAVERDRLRDELAAMLTVALPRNIQKISSQLPEAKAQWDSGNPKVCNQAFEWCKDLLEAVRVLTVQRDRQTIESIKSDRCAFASDLLNKCQAREIAQLTERLRMAQHGETEALKMMASHKTRADQAEVALKISGEVEDYPLGGN